MTDPFPLHTHTAPASRSIGGSIASHGPDQNHEEVEDYTIKCICGFQEDDGNTVYCERCDTWQHTECYYIDEQGIVPAREHIEVRLFEAIAISAILQEALRKMSRELPKDFHLLYSY